jgi:predicted small lipoprotein YifL
MKKTLKSVCIASAVLALTACTSTIPLGAIITDVELPIAVTAAKVSSSKQKVLR